MDNFLENYSNISIIIRKNGDTVDFKELKSVIEINSFTKNKKGVDEVGKIFTKWLEELGYRVDIYEREDIGNHPILSLLKEMEKRFCFLVILILSFQVGEFEEFREDDEWVYGAGVCDMKVW